MLASSLIVTLTAESRPGCYLLSWGMTSYPIEFRPETDVILGDLLRRLQPVLTGGRDSSEKLAPLELLQALGTRLWHALLPETAPVEKCEALGNELRTGSTPLLLAIPASPATLPWELLCDPQAPDGTGFLARRRPLARLIPGGTRLPTITPPLRVLLLISSPLGLEERQRIDIESERTAVESATREAREAGLLHLFVEDIVTPRRVQQVLLRFKPHLLHYIGHGGYDEDVGGYLLWEDEQGDPLPFLDSRLADLLRPRGLRVVLLHGCKTASTESRTEFRSIAGALLDAGIPAVLAQQANFTYESSQRASESFYTALTAGLGLADSTFEARQALALSDRPDWAVPRLQATLGGLAPLLDADAPPGIPDPTLANNGAPADLPTPTGVFVGRQREMRALRSILESAPGSGAVLALITGPGGVGKSTLVAQAVKRYGGRYKATLTLSCAGYQGLDLFLRRIGEFLQRQGMPEFLEETLPNPKLSINAKIEAAIENLNRAGPCLLVVDNLESVQQEDHTLPDPDLLLLLQKLLTNLRGGRVLITGRYAVEGLLPHGKFAAHLLRLELDDLSTRETEQLLESHYSLARLHESVRAELIRAFGGLPYIYDLLSTQAATQNLAALIHDAQGRITREHQQLTAAEWQRVRRQVIEFATLETSIAQLPESARKLLARLSIFRRPFPQEALEQGLGAVWADWQPLLDRALLRYSPVNRVYQLHSLTAHYVQGQLDTLEYKTTQVQVAEWYFDYASNTSHELADYLEAYYLFRVANETQRAGELAIDLAASLRRFGLYNLLRDLYTTTISESQGQKSSLIAEAYRQLGMIAREQGQYKEAQRLFGEALPLFEQLGDQGGHASTLYDLGTIAQALSQYDDARRLYRESQKLIEHSVDESKSIRAPILHQLGIIAQEQGQYKEAQRLFGEALFFLEQLDDLKGRASTLLHLGIIAMEQGQYDEGWRLQNETLNTFKQLGDQKGMALTFHQLGMIAQAQGRYENARRAYSEALTTFEQLGDLSGRAITLHQLGMMAQEQGQYDEAEHRYKESLTLEERMGNRRGHAISLEQLGVIARVREKYEEAWQLLCQALTIFEQLGDQSNRAEALRQLGIVAREQGQYDEAEQRYKESLTLEERMGDLHGYASSLFELGTIAHLQGQYDEAREQYTEALTTYERLGALREYASTLHHLGIVAKKQGQYKEAQQLLSRALITFEQLGNLHQRADTLYQLGVLAQEQEQYDDARRLYSEALLLFKQLGDLKGYSSSLSQLGDIAYLQDLHDEALQKQTEALTLFKQLDDQEGLARSLYRLGVLAQEQGQYDEARRLISEALLLFKQLGDLKGYANALHQLGIIEQGQGLYEEARSSYQEALTLFKQQGNDRGYALSLHQLGMIAQEQEQYSEAQQKFNEALKTLEQLGDLHGRATTLGQLGFLARQQSDFVAALDYLLQSLAIFEQLGDLHGRATTLGQLGLLARQQNDHPAALSYLLQSSAIFDQLRSPYCDPVENTIVELRIEIGSGAFATLWQKVTSQVLLSDLPAVDPLQSMPEHLIAFLQSLTWFGAQRIAEASPDLLSIEIDAFLKAMVVARKDEDSRRSIEERRQLLARCREIGVVAAFAERAYTI